MSDLLTSHKLKSNQIVNLKVTLSLKSMTSKSKLNKKFCIVAGFARPILPSFIVKLRTMLCAVGLCNKHCEHIFYLHENLIFSVNFDPSIW